MTLPKLNGCTISNSDGDLPIYEPPAGGRPTNVFTMHTGASRPGIGRFLMQNLDFQSLEETGTLKMQGPPGPGISFKVVIAGAVPYSTSTDQDDSDLGGTMMEVIVFDMREQATNPSVSAAFNVQQQAFPYSDPSTPVFYQTTIDSGGSGDDWEWTDVIAQLQNDPTFPQFIDIPDPVPTWNPRNLIYDCVSSSKIIDDIAEQLYIVTGFDYTQSDFLQAYDYYPPGSSTGSDGSDSGNTSTLNAAKNYLIMGANPTNPATLGNMIGTDSWLRPKTRFPHTIRVAFKTYNNDDPANPYPVNTGTGTGFGTFWRAYTVDVTTDGGSANPNYILPINYGSYIAVVSAGNVFNGDELNTVGKDIGKRALANMQVPIGEKMFAGIWDFIPDGLIRGIQWVNNAHGATTRIRINNERDFDPFTETKRAVDSISNQAIVGLGTQNIGASPSGSRMSWAGGPNWIPVKLGSATADGPNRWLYKFTQVQPCSTSINPSGWSITVNGITDVTFGAKARNGLEANNSGTGTQGCGINVNNLTGNFQLVPIGTNAIVQLWLLSQVDDGKPAPWFFQPNQPDGSCTGIASGTGTGT